MIRNSPAPSFAGSRACVLACTVIACRQNLPTPEAPAPAAPAVAGPAASIRAGVTAANPYAVEAGLEVLRAGGSAADAAVAVQSMLGLVEPQSSGLGGGAFALYYEARSGTVTAFDGREAAPAGARPDMFLDEQRTTTFLHRRGNERTLHGGARRHRDARCRARQVRAVALESTVRRTDPRGRVRHRRAAETRPVRQLADAAGVTGGCANVVQKA